MKMKRGGGGGSDAYVYAILTEHLRNARQADEWKEMGEALYMARY